VPRSRRAGRRDRRAYRGRSAHRRVRWCMAGAAAQRRRRSSADPLVQAVRPLGNFGVRACPGETVGPAGPLAASRPLDVHRAIGVPKGASGVALYTSKATVMVRVRALAGASQTAWLAGMTGLGDRHGALLRPSPNPRNRMVEPKSWGHHHSLLWAQRFALLP
jgi:hypothetical protein